MTPKLEPEMSHGASTPGTMKCKCGKVLKLEFIDRFEVGFYCPRCQEVYTDKGKVHQ